MHPVCTINITSTKLLWSWNLSLKLFHFNLFSACDVAVFSLELFALKRWLASKGGIIQGDGRKLLGHFTRHFRSQTSSESSSQGHMKRINPKFATKKVSFMIFVSFRVRMLLSDVWSRSSFWVTVHASRVLVSAKQSIVYWGLAHLHLQTVIKVTFVADVGFIR